MSIKPDSLICPAAAICSKGIWEYNLQTYTFRHSENLLRVIEAGVDSIGSLDEWLNKLPADTSVKLRTALQSYKNGKIKSYSMNYSIMLPYDEKIIGHQSKATEFDETGAAVKITAVEEDVTTRTLIEKKLRETNLRFSKLIQNMNTGVLLENVRREILYTNKKFCEIFDINLMPELLIGADCDSSAQQIAGLIVNPENFFKEIETTLENKIPKNNVVVELNNGKILERDYIPIIFNDEYHGHLWHYRDITDHRRAENEIMQALEREKQHNEMKSRFVSLVSHEFRTPLAAILSSTEILETYSDIWTAEKKESHFLSIKKSVSTLIDMINDITEINRAESGKISIKPSDFEIISFMEELISEIKLSCKSYPKINIINSCTHIEVFTDKKIMRQILLNLLGNSVKYTPPEKSVFIDLTGWEKDLKIIIKDEGIGIPDEDQPKIFEPFTRASNTGNRKGTGLGLSIVKRALDSIDGKIKLKSQLNQGTEFIVFIPGIIKAEYEVRHASKNTRY